MLILSVLKRISVTDPKSVNMNRLCPWSRILILVVGCLICSNTSQAQRFAPEKTDLRVHRNHYRMQASNPAKLPISSQPSNKSWPKLPEPRVLRTFPVVIDRNQIVPVGNPQRVPNLPEPPSTFPGHKVNQRVLPKPILLPKPPRTFVAESNIPSGPLDQMLVRMLFQEQSLKKWCGPDHPELIKIRDRIQLVRELLAKQVSEKQPTETAVPLLPTMNHDSTAAELPTANAEYTMPILQPVSHEAPVQIPYLNPPKLPVSVPNFVDKTLQALQKSDETIAPTEPKHPDEPAKFPKNVSEQAPTIAPISSPAREVTEQKDTTKTEESFWHSPHFAYLAGILSAMAFGLVIHLTFVSVLLRRYREQTSAPIRLAVVESQNGLTITTPHESPTENSESSNFSEEEVQTPIPENIPQEPESTAEEFDLGLTYEEEQTLRQEQVKQQDNAILKQILEDNLKLQEKLHED